MKGEGGRGTIGIKEKITLIHPLYADCTVTVAEGEELPVLCWSINGGICTFTLDEQRLNGKNTWSCPEDVLEWKEALPENAPLPPQPATSTQVVLPSKWTTKNISIDSPIIPGGNFTWREATHGGSRMPESQEVVDAIIRIAAAAQEVRDRLRLPMTVTSWYRPPAANRACGGAKFSRHLKGDALDFVVDGMTGHQLFKFLDPWWHGGLGKYPRFPNLIHIDARGHQSRWER